MSITDNTQLELLNIATFRIRYGCSRSTVYKLILSGELRAVKVGRRTFIRIEDAEAWRNALPSYVSPPSEISDTDQYAGLSHLGQKDGENV